jgi:hypothetical protein
VTGRKLGVAIHQHYGDRLHLVWRVTGWEQEAAIEQLFLWSSDIEDLCRELVHTLPEGLCTCVFICPPINMEGNVYVCNKRRPHASERYKP